MTVYVIATGGTISSHFDGTDWTNLDGPTLIHELGPLPVEVRVDDVAAGPSSNQSADDMVAIADHVRAALDAGARGVVVVHGTDTMELSAFMVQLLLGTVAGRPPVVFTGSMRVHSHARPDGPRNLRDAIAVAASDGAVGREVLVCVEGVLHAADRVRKQVAVSVDAFASTPFAPVGRVDEGVVTFDMAPAARRPARGVSGPVPLIVCYPGITADTVGAALDGCRGAVVEGYGDLNVPHAIWGPLLVAAQQGMLVVLASSAFTPNVGDDGLRQLGVVGAGGLTAQKARLALMAALGSTDDREQAIEMIHQYALAYDARDRSNTP
jgi:L-asparaginase